MKNDLLEHNGYQGSVEFSSEDKILYGKILFIDSLVMYHGESVNELDEAFRIAVNEYLAHCLKNNKEPNKPYCGGFNVRIGPELHKTAVQRAYVEGKSLNEFVKQSIERAVTELPLRTHEVTINHVVTHQHTVETIYSTEDASWQSPAPRKPKLNVVQ
ncbi:MAG: type II toxin-antitoxin system HicB family antitoxin [Sideroxydans sp.]|nr:type II toxin-antitoxin system HicB family antitoxin [Sideroxydans sp.]